MKNREDKAGTAGPHRLSEWPGGERAIWLAIVCLLGALLGVRSGLAPGPAMLLANPLALALFAAFYALIRVREAGGRP